jgi:hypothetical protein
MDPLPPPPDVNPQEESPGQIQRNVLADVERVARPPDRADARGQAQLLDHALLALFLVVSSKIGDSRLLSPAMAIFVIFFGDHTFRSINYLEAILIREPLRPRDYSVSSSWYARRCQIQQCVGL